MFRSGLWRVRFKGALGHPKVKRSLAAMAGAMGIFFLSATLFWFPSASRRGRLEREISSRRSSLREARDRNAAADHFNRIQGTLARIQEKWRVLPDPSSMVRDVSRLALKRRLKLISQDMETVDVKGRGAFQQDLTLVGDYAGIRGFLTDLEDLPTLTVVERSKFESGEDGRILRVELELCTFYPPGYEREGS